MGEHEGLDAAYPGARAESRSTHHRNQSQRRRADHVHSTCSVCIPALVGAGANAYYLWNEHWEHWSHMPPLEERVEYPYQNIRWVPPWSRNHVPLSYLERLTIMTWGQNEELPMGRR